jgi:hypothetical protein
LSSPKKIIILGEFDCDEMMELGGENRIDNNRKRIVEGLERRMSL